jgi:hypothetical protein
VAGRPLRPATRRRLGRPSPHQQADRPRAHPRPENLSPHADADTREYPVLAPVSEGYPKDWGRLLTCYSPVRRSRTPERAFPLDLHVLSTPPAFVLSQDQTLQRKPKKSLKTFPANKKQTKTQNHTTTKNSDSTTPGTKTHWLLQHPVEFSKNKHTPPPTPHTKEGPDPGQLVQPSRSVLSCQGVCPNFWLTDRCRTPRACRPSPAHLLARSPLHPQLPRLSSWQPLTGNGWRLYPLGSRPSNRGPMSRSAARRFRAVPCGQTETYATAGRQSNRHSATFATSAPIPPRYRRQRTDPGSPEIRKPRACHTGRRRFSRLGNCDRTRCIRLTSRSATTRPTSSGTWAMMVPQGSTIMLRP